MAIWLPVSKNRVYSSFVVISRAFSAALFWVFHLMNREQHGENNLLTLWGKNPLMLYIMHFLLIGVVFLPGIPGLYEQAPIWITMIESFVLLASLTWIARILDK